jgi:hypothetical protein
MPPLEPTFHAPMRACAVRPHAGTAHASPLLTRIAAYVTPDLLLQHSDETLATYVRNS